MNGLQTVPPPLRQARRRRPAAAPAGAAAGLGGWPALPALAGLACIAAFAGLLVLGRWQVDEYTMLVNQRQWGPGILPGRLLYSPRPLSEGLLFLYGWAVLATGRAMVASSLALLWAGTLACCVLAARSVLPPRRGRWLSALALGIMPFAFALMTEPVTEVFYWPMSTAAYLPTLAAATALLWLVSRPGHRRIAAAALLAAACSTEIGAALAAGFAAAAAAATLWDRRAGRRAAVLWWLLPGLAGIAVLAIIVSVRADIVELGADRQPFTGHAATAVGLAVRTVLLELADGGGILRRLLFATGFVLLWRQADPAGATPGRWQAVLAAALAGAALFSVAAAFYHYGALCCERQSTTRHWLLMLLLIQGVAALAAWRPAWASAWASTWAPSWTQARLPRWLAPALLAAAVVPGPTLWTELHTTYGNARFGTQARARTWQSGHEPGAAMQFFLPPDGPDMLVRGTGLPLGIYRAGIDAPDLLTEAGRFFGKTTLIVCQPWQTDRDWLVNGTTIPACPPTAAPAQAPSKAPAG